MEVQSVIISAIKKSGFTHVSCDRLFHVKELPYLSIVQATEGSYSVCCDDSAMHNTGENGIFIAPAYTVQKIIHHVNPQSRHMSARWLFMDIRINEIYRFDRLFVYPLIPCAEKRNLMNAMLDQLFQTDDACENMISCYHIVQSLLSMATPKQAMDPRIEKALYFIERHYCEPLDISRISREVHMSAPNLHAVFKRETGASPIAYLNNFRLVTACDLLENSNLSIGEIAERVGISDSFYFSRLFKQHYQCSPKQYRESMQYQNKKR